MQNTSTHNDSKIIITTVNPIPMLFQNPEKFTPSKAIQAHNPAIAINNSKEN